jgi:hypothetical protein
MESRIAYQSSLHGRPELFGLFASLALTHNLPIFLIRRVIRLNFSYHHPIEGRRLLHDFAIRRRHLPLEVIRQKFYGRRNRHSLVRPKPLHFAQPLAIDCNLESREVAGWGLVL